MLPIRRLHQLSPTDIDALSAVLIDCVEGGASVSFMHPLPLAKAQAFWRQADEDLRRGARALLVADDDQGIAATVQLLLEQPENQPHRADLAKMLVHRRARCRGVGAVLLASAEQLGRDCGKTLLLLDPASAEAERLYVRGGWQRCGTVPGYALLPHGGRCATTFYFRELR